MTVPHGQAVIRSHRHAQHHHRGVPQQRGRDLPGGLPRNDPSRALAPLLRYQDGLSAVPAGPGGLSSFAGTALGSTDCVPCGLGNYSALGICKPCSTLSCLGVGKTLIPCQADANAYCGTCTNKPAGSVYTGPSNAVGGDCPWAYTPPCPVRVEYYKTRNGSLCVACPIWSTTQAVGAVSLSQPVHGWCGPGGKLHHPLALP